VATQGRVSDDAAPTGAAGLDALPEPHALIFDLDGTLVDTVGQRIEAWLRTFAEVGVEAEREHVARLIGADGRRLAQEVAAVAGKQLAGATVDRLGALVGELFGELNRDPRPLPGVPALLRALESSDLLWAIATSSRAEQVQTSVDALGLEAQPRIIDGSHVEHAKPAPDLLLLAAEQLGQSPRSCWYVGDATWDMLAARGANMPAVGIASGAVSGDALLEAGASAVATIEALAADLRRRGLLGGAGLISDGDAARVDERGASAG
jgi:HAD superfamily hydrolase (TIGR01509 family)